MNSSNSNRQHDQSTVNYQNPVQENPNIPQRIALSSEEITVLKQCNQESFWYRCLPVGVGLMVLTQAYTRSLSKTIVAGVFGYLSGKVSYAETCRQRILQLENSSLAESIRKGRRGATVGFDMLQDMGSTPTTVGPSYEPTRNTTSQDDYHTSTDFNIENANTHEGLDDLQRPTLDRDSDDMQPNKKDKPSYTSYEELKVKNRKDFNDGIQSKIATTQNMPQRPRASYRRPSPSFGHTAPASSIGTEKNDYGDVWDE